MCNGMRPEPNPRLSQRQELVEKLDADGILDYLTQHGVLEPAFLARLGAHATSSDKNLAILRQVELHAQGEQLLINALRRSWQLGLASCLDTVQKIRPALGTDRRKGQLTVKIKIKSIKIRYVKPTPAGKLVEEDKSSQSVESLLRLTHRTCEGGGDGAAAACTSTRADSHSAEEASHTTDPGPGVVLVDSTDASGVALIRNEATDEVEEDSDHNSCWCFCFFLKRKSKSKKKKELKAGTHLETTKGTVASVESSSKTDKQPLNVRQRLDVTSSTQKTKKNSKSESCSVSLKAEKKIKKKKKEKQSRRALKSSRVKPQSSYVYETSDDTEELTGQQSPGTDHSPRSDEQLLTGRDKALGWGSKVLTFTDLDSSHTDYSPELSQLTKPFIGGDILEYAAAAQHPPTLEKRSWSRFEAASDTTATRQTTLPVTNFRYNENILSGATFVRKEVKLPDYSIACERANLPGDFVVNKVPTLSISDVVCEEPTPSKSNAVLEGPTLSGNDIICEEWLHEGPSFHQKSALVCEHLAQECRLDIVKYFERERGILVFEVAHRGCEICVVCICMHQSHLTSLRQDLSQEVLVTKLEGFLSSVNVESLGVIQVQPAVLVDEAEINMALSELS